MSAQASLDEALNSLIITDTSAPPLFGAIVGFVRRVVKALVGYFKEYVADARELDDIDALRARVTALEQHQPSAATVAMPHSKPPTLSSSATASNRNLRCNRCHARGHSQQECKSINPEVTRRRVAKNRKANAALRLTATAPLLSPPPLVPPAHAFSALASPLDPRILALVADSTELQRRTAQSSRDKKRARANRTSVPSTHQ
jgi:hypothetical protein